MKSNFAGWVLALVSLNTAVVGYLWVLIMCVTRRAEWSSLRFQGAGVLTARRTDHAENGFSTTVGRGIVYSRSVYDETSAIDNSTERHEFVHIKQYEDDALRSLVLGLAMAGASQEWWVFVAIYASAPAWMLTNYVTAVLRYGWMGLYRDAEHERSAYAQTDLVKQAVASGFAWKGWDQLRDEARKAQTRVAL